VGSIGYVLTTKTAVVVQGSEQDDMHVMMVDESPSSFDILARAN